MSATFIPRFTPAQADTIRWAEAVIARGEYPSMASVLAEARSEGSPASREKIWRARKSLIRRGLFPGADQLTAGESQRRRLRGGDVVRPDPPPGPRRPRHAFARDCRRQREILAAMRRWKWELKSQILG